MDTYQKLHPDYTELEVHELTGHVLKLVTPDVRFAAESLAWVSDREVGKYMGADFSNVSLEGEKKRLREIVEDKDAYHWIIEVDGKAVGNININCIAETAKEFNVKSGKLNYLIGDTTLWGKGIMTAVAKAVLDWAFSNGKFEIIKSRVLIQNKASHTVLKKLGFKEYGKEAYDGPEIGESTWYVAYKITK